METSMFTIQINDIENSEIKTNDINEVLINTTSIVENDQEKFTLIDNEIFQKEKVKLEQKLNQLENDYNKLQEKCDEMSIEKKQHENIIQKILKDMSLLKNNLILKHNDVNDIKISLQIAIEEIRKKSEKIIDLSVKNDELLTNVKELENCLNEIKFHKIELYEDNLFLEKSNIDSRNTISNLEKYISSIENEYLDLHNILNNDKIYMEEELCKFTSMIETYEQENSTLNTENTKLRDENLELKQSIELIENYMTRLRDIIIKNKNTDDYNISEDIYEDKIYQIYDLLKSELEQHKYDSQLLEEQKNKINCTLQEFSLLSNLLETKENEIINKQKKISELSNLIESTRNESKHIQKTSKETIDDLHKFYENQLSLQKSHTDENYKMYIEKCESFDKLSEEFCKIKEYNDDLMKSITNLDNTIMYEQLEHELTKNTLKTYQDNNSVLISNNNTLYESSKEYEKLKEEVELLQNENKNLHELIIEQNIQYKKEIDELNKQNQSLEKQFNINFKELSECKKQNQSLEKQLSINIKELNEFKNQNIALEKYRNDLENKLNVFKERIISLENTIENYDNTCECDTCSMVVEDYDDNYDNNYSDDFDEL